MANDPVTVPVKGIESARILLEWAKLQPAA
jgi:hypothetical protein